MLAELFLFATAASARPLRRLGLVRDAVALWSRATRRRAEWREHERRCHAVVLRAVEGLASRRTAVVLGSGLLRDVPAEALAAAFERVVLVDAVHLWPARRRAGRLGFAVQVADLSGVTTGGADALAALKADGTVDLVISACCLSQLPHAPGRRDDDGTLPARLVRRHLQDLAEFAGRVCLLSDVFYEVRRPDGSVEERHDLLAGIALPEPDGAWDWVVAPPGEIERRRAYVHRVHAFHDFRLGRTDDDGGAEAAYGAATFRPAPP